MRTRVENLRLGLALGAGGLVLVVAGFLAFAHYRSVAFKAALPGKLGANITREANGYTWSQTVQGRTVFTLHAAKLEQKQDGTYTLHDVVIVLYGRKQDRTDRIYGKEFEYDQAAGVVRGIGVVHMDLQAPASANGEHKDRPPGSEDGMIHVLTSSLVYLEKLGVAATSEDIEFAQAQMKGWAHGADYNSDSSVLVLQSAVRMNGLTKNGPVVTTASRGEWNRREQTLNLSGAKVVTTEQTIEAEHALINLTTGGQPERIQAEDRVSVTRVEGGVLHAARANVNFGTNGKAKDALFTGGVTYTDDEEARQAHGQSQQARVTFDGAGQAERVLMTGGAAIEERERGAASEAWNTRNVSGQTVDVALAPVTGMANHRQIRDADATGAAHVVFVSETSNKKTGAAVGPTRTEMMGDDLKAHFLAGNQVERVVGTGHTSLHQVNALGVDEVSTGDTTELVFRPVAGAVKKAGAGGMRGVAEELASALQLGHVSTIRKRMQTKAGAAAPVVVEERATSDRAAFDAEANRVTLTGGVQLTNVGSTLWGTKVVVERGTGDATAEGDVRVNYAQTAKDGSDAEPIHVTSDHAELKRGPATTKDVKSAGDDTAFFYGVPGRPARLWQAGSQVQAPVLKFEQGAKRLTANGPGSGMVVHAVLVESARTPKPANPPKKDAKPPSVVRIASHEMVYSDGAHEVVFTGGVLVEDADGSMKARKATAYLTTPDKTAPVAKNPVAKNPVPKGASEGFLGGGVDHVIATGDVEIDQPGRHGTGDQLVYTASDQMYVLTGTREAQPRMSDETRGTVTGESIRFHTGDDSVVVTGESIEDGKGKTVHRRTETRVKQ